MSARVFVCVWVSGPLGFLSCSHIFWVLWRRHFNFNLRFNSLCPEHCDTNHKLHNQSPNFLVLSHSSELKIMNVVNSKAKAKTGYFCWRNVHACITLYVGLYVLQFTITCYYTITILLLLLLHSYFNCFQKCIWLFHFNITTSIFLWFF